jgi:hypothetical protein
MLRSTALALIISLSSCSFAYGQGTPAVVTQPKVLRGEVADCGIFTEELQARMGLGIARVKGKLVVALVMDGMGKSAGLKEGDELLDASTEDNIILLKVERAGTVFNRRIDLATGRTLAAAAQDVTAPGHKAATTNGGVQENVYFHKRAGILQFGDGYLGPRDKNGNYWPGWTDEDVQDTRVWTNEFYRDHVDGPLKDPWVAKIAEARKLANDYMQKYWPDTVIGWRSYHIVVDRSGKIIRYFQDPEIGINWADNDAQWNRLASGLIDGLSKSRVFACPPGSKVERFQTGVDIEVFHDPHKRY